MQEQEHWDLIIRPQNKWYNVNFKAIWRYRDLLLTLVKRDFLAIYKQTILGPLWFFIQPLLTSLTFTFIFGKVAKISTDGTPPLLFYLCGIAIWTYFSDCLIKTSNTFVANAKVFGKVYFPRLIIPLSVLVSNLIKFGLQFLIFACCWAYYLFFSGVKITPHWELMWIFPILVVMMAGLGLGAGIFISSLTTKYRDLSFLVGFGVQLLMYASSVVLPISTFSIHTQKIMLLNPLTSIIETFKYVFIGSGTFEPIWLCYAFGFMLLLLAVSVLIFNRVEKTFMDTV
jgi:lipopolysaccharide transport system permease protein